MQARIAMGIAGIANLSRAWDIQPKQALSTIWAIPMNVQYPHPSQLHLSDGDTLER
jgi:hypothetical protein